MIHMIISRFFPHLRAYAARSWLSLPVTKSRNSIIGLEVLMQSCLTWHKKRSEHFAFTPLFVYTLDSLSSTLYPKRRKEATLERNGVEDR
jgi:hypothetical protein